MAKKMNAKSNRGAGANRSAANGVPDKAKMAEALEKGRGLIKILLAEAMKTMQRNPGILPNNPDYATAFGIAYGFALVGLWKEPGYFSSEFQTMVNDAERILPAR